MGDNKIQRIIKSMEAKYNAAVQFAQELTGYVEGRIVITHGFIKKTQKTPRAQIELAKKYRADFLKRQQSETRKGRR